MIGKIKPREWNLTDLKGERYGLSERCWASFVEACAVCLEAQGHKSGVRLHISWNDSDAEAALKWAPLERRSKRSHGDPNRAVEDGAYCVAILLICEHSGLLVVERSAGENGIDWWLGRRGEEGSDDELFQRSARIEVSGIGSDPKAVASRMRQKIKQTTRSDGTGLLAYVVVVEFGTPQAQVVERSPVEVRR